MDEPLRRCARGNHWLPATLEFFYASRRDHLSYYCKQCTKDYARENQRKWNEGRLKRRAAHEATI